jgi:hypothetical protein
MIFLLAIIVGLLGGWIYAGLPGTSGSKRSSGHTPPVRRKDTRSYLVPDVSYGHWRAAITEEAGAVPGLESVAVDLEAKRAEVTGVGLDDAPSVPRSTPPATGRSRAPKCRSALSTSS